VNQLKTFDLSVVIATYNRAHLLGDALAALADQRTATGVERSSSSSIERYSMVGIWSTTRAWQCSIASAPIACARAMHGGSSSIMVKGTPVSRWTCYLRTDSRSSDGAPCTAHDSTRVARSGTGAKSGSSCRSPANRAA
jgi:hypothetical protein